MDIRFRHFIFTRFLCESFGQTDEQLLSEDRIRYHMCVLKSNFIKTLENQTNQDFEVVIVVHDDLDSKYVEQLENIDTSLDIYVIKRKDIDDFIRTIDTREYDYVILSRQDDDDFLKKNVVQDTQDAIQLCTNGVLCYGYTNGYIGFSWIDKVVNMNVRYKCGHFSCMQSFIFDCHRAPILQSTLFARLTDVEDILRNICEQNNIEFSLDTNIKVGPNGMYIWYRHSDTGTKIHERYDSEEFVQRYGEAEQKCCKEYGVYKKWYDQEGVSIDKSEFGWK